MGLHIHLCVSDLKRTKIRSNFVNRVVKNNSDLGHAIKDVQLVEMKMLLPV